MIEAVVQTTTTPAKPVAIRQRRNTPTQTAIPAQIPSIDELHPDHSAGRTPKEHGNIAKAESNKDRSELFALLGDRNIFVAFRAAKVLLEISPDPEVKTQARTKLLALLESKDDNLLACFRSIYRKTRDRELKFAINKKLKLVKILKPINREQAKLLVVSQR